MKPSRKQNYKFSERNKSKANATPMVNIDVRKEVVDPFFDPVPSKNIRHTILINKSGHEFLGSPPEIIMLWYGSESGDNFSKVVDDIFLIPMKSGGQKLTKLSTKGVSFSASSQLNMKGKYTIRIKDGQFQLKKIVLHTKTR